MLLKYSVSNFKSIGHNIEFSMFPLENTDDKYLSTIETIVGTWRVLKRGAFFGPNASGKTSFVQSLAYARDYIVKGPRNNTVTKVNQFRGNIEELNGATSFEFIIYIDGQVYDYGFSLDRAHIREEWLSILSPNGFEELFHRTLFKNGKPKIKIFDRFASKKSIDRGLAILLTNTIKEKQTDSLFLFKLYENGINVGEKIYSWFEKIQIIYPDTQLQSLPLILQTDEQFRDFLSKKLHLLDTGIDNVFISENNIELSEFADKYNVPNEIVHDIEETQNGLINFNGKFFLFKESRGRKIKLLQLKFDHSFNSPFDIDDESDGTKRLLDLLPILFNLDNDSNTIYVIDELDRSLHTKLSKYFVEAFAKSSTNTQLLFTAHDTNLLDLEIFRKEEIWFVEKKLSGETKLRPLSNFPIKDNQDILKGYLLGRFGAVPIIKEEKE
ncbi:MAG: ATP-binding protein [Ruminococcus sp.]|nr:ATP-binding protein [Ruminococcus sp.]